MNYVSLHNHTTFSIMDSLIKPSELFKRAKELEQPAIAVTDHGTCAGLWDCLKLSRETGIKLIAGCEMYFVDDVKDTDVRLRHIVLLAKNAEGYRNLLTLVKEGFDNKIIALRKVFPRIDWSILKKYSTGLICTTACGNGIISQLLNDKKFEEAKEQVLRLKGIFEDDLAVELQPHSMRRKSNLYGNEVDQVFTNRQLKKLADELGIKCIIATDAHYVRQEQHKAHDVMLAIASGQPITSGARLKYDVPDFYMKSEEEIVTKLKRIFGEKFVQDCIDNTVYFADKCEFPAWIDPKYSNPSGKELPEFPVQDQEDYNKFKEWADKNKLNYGNDEYLKYKCNEAMGEDNYGEDYRKRVEEELDVLCHCGVAGYMLIVMDLLEWCRKNNVSYGPGRGCLSGDALVLTSQGFKQLADIATGNKVYTHTGKRRKVLNTLKYNMKKELCLKVYTRNSFGPITLTKDHELYASKLVDETNKFTRGYLNITETTKGYNKPTWIKASHLRKGDVVFFTFPKRKINNRIYEFDLGDFIDGHRYEVDEKYLYSKRQDGEGLSLRRVASSSGINFEKLRKYKFYDKLLSKTDTEKLTKYLFLNKLSVQSWLKQRCQVITKAFRKFVVDTDTAYLLGRWVGDGSYHGKKNNRRGINISFNANDIKGIEKVYSIFIKLGFHPVVCKSKDSNGLNITVSNYPLFSLFRSIFPDYENSYTKHLPEFFRNLNDDLLKSLLQGLKDSDGSFVNNRQFITTTSSRLAAETKELLLYLKIPSAVYHSETNRYGKKMHDAYSIRFDNQNLTNDHGYYSRIANIEECKLEKVYDLTVDVDNSYLTSNCVVHNSVGGSLVAYLLGIHKADPIKYGLVFSRFHNKLKEDYSDCDLDFSTRNRYKVINYVVSKYGADSVAAISNYNTLTPKVYAKAIARTFEYGGNRKAAVQVGAAIADSIPTEINTIKSALSNAPLFSEYAKRYTELEEYSSDIGGLVVAASTHAAGIIINKRNLLGLVPLRRDKDGNLSIEYEKNRAEENGLVKMDFLGVSTLDVIDDTYKLIKNCGKQIKPFDYNTYNKEAYDLISIGNTFGVFQFGTSPGTKSLCQRYKPQNMEDLAIITTLARPAAKNIREDFFKTKEGKKNVELLHPLLERAFKNTLGFALFDESLLLMTEDIAGWNLHEADSLRKLTKAKGKYPEEAEKVRIRFIEDATKNGLSNKMAVNIWEKVIDPFQKYSFNKSHAILYSMISYHTAWLKAHFPLEFLVANLMSEVNSNAQNSKDKIAHLKEEIRQLKVKILPPDINTSNTTYTIIDDNTLMTGMDALKNMGKDAVPEILAKRPFTSFEDFIFKTDGRKVRADAIQALAASGSLDSFGFTRKQMYLYTSDIKKKIQVHMKKPEATRGEFKYPWPEDVGEWSVTELHAMEREYLGEGLTGTKFEVYNGFFTKSAPSFKKMSKIHPPPPEDMTEKDQRKYTKHITMVQAEVRNFFEFKVKKEDSKIHGEVMAKVALSDPWGNQMMMTCFPDGWVHLQNRISELLNNKYKFDTGLGLYINGELNWYEGDISLIFGDVARCCPPPQLPIDRVARKVSIRSPRKKRNVDDTERDVLLEEIEDEMVDSGYADLDDDDDIQDGFV